MWGGGGYNDFKVQFKWVGAISEGCTCVLVCGHVTQWPDMVKGWGEVMGGRWPAAASSGAS